MKRSTNTDYQSYQNYWKHYAKEKVKWQSRLKEKLRHTGKKDGKRKKQSKKTLALLNIQKPIFGNPHQVQKSVPKNPTEVRKAEVKARMLTGTYMLQDRQEQ